MNPILSREAAVEHADTNHARKSIRQKNPISFPSKAKQIQQKFRFDGAAQKTRIEAVGY